MSRPERDSDVSSMASPSRRTTLRWGAGGVVSAAALGLPGLAQAAKPEDVFKGQIVLCSTRLPMRFSTSDAFIAAIKKAKTDKLWPTEQKGNDHALWNIEYIAFFASPLPDSEINLKFFDVTSGGMRFVAGDEQYTREKGTRIFASNIQVGKPEFDVNRKYMMTIQTGPRRIAMTTFWLRGKGPDYSGKVEFSDDEAKGR